MMDGGDGAVAATVMKVVGVERRGAVLCELRTER
jgi:hypothetical protein